MSSNSSCSWQLVATLLFAERKSFCASLLTGRSMWFSKSVRLNLRRDTVSNLGTQIYEINIIASSLINDGCACWCARIRISPSISFQQLHWRDHYACLLASEKICSREDPHRILPSHLHSNTDTSQGSSSKNYLYKKSKCGKLERGFPYAKP